MFRTRTDQEELTSGAKAPR